MVKYINWHVNTAATVLLYPCLFDTVQLVDALNALMMLCLTYLTPTTPHIFLN
jgi:hypothetical protein